MIITNRRTFSKSLIATALFDSAADAVNNRNLKAVAFDAFALLDPRSVFARCEELFPGQGSGLAAGWRDRQFEYCWLRTMTCRYADFWQVTDDALTFTAKMLGLDLTSSKRVALMNAYLEIRCWTDVRAGLRALQDSGIRLALLSNMTAKMLEAGIRNSGLEAVFEHVLSTDRVSAFKPDPRAYQMGLDAFGLRREEILFAAFAGWDASGAKEFGFPTFWLNRQRQPAEELGVTANGVGTSIVDLVRFIER